MQRDILYHTHMRKHLYVDTDRFLLLSQPPAPASPFTPGLTNSLSTSAPSVHSQLSVIVAGSFARTEAGHTFHLFLLATCFWILIADEHFAAHRQKSLDTCLLSAGAREASLKSINRLKVVNILFPGFNPGSMLPACLLFSRAGCSSAKEIQNENIHEVVTGK